MGCGASSAQENLALSNDSAPVPAGNSPNKPPHSNGVAGKTRTDHSTSNGIQSPRKPVSRPVAFDIDIDENKENNNNTQNLAKKPQRLNDLAPLTNAPVLTAEMLEEKMRQAEEKREQQLEKKREVSRRTSRLRQNILRAQEFEINEEQTKQKEEIEQKMRSADRNRELKRQEMEAKKRQREERARQIRERARRIKDGETSDAEFEIEKDDGFNEDDVDSWLGDDDALTQVTDVMSERFNSGVDSLRKGITNERSPRGFSASTCTADSFSLHRDHTLMSIQEKKNEFDEASRDDFFDS